MGSGSGCGASRERRCGDVVQHAAALLLHHSQVDSGSRARPFEPVGRDWRVRLHRCGEGRDAASSSEDLERLGRIRRSHGLSVPQVREQAVRDVGVRAGNAMALDLPREILWRAHRHLAAPAGRTAWQSKYGAVLAMPLRTWSAQLCVQALRGDSAPASRLPCDPRDVVGGAHSRRRERTNERTNERIMGDTRHRRQTTV